MNHSAISNTYLMEQAPKERTPIDIHVNGKRGRCPNHGIVQVKVITSLMLGSRHNLKTGEDEARSIHVCARCNSVIQRSRDEEAKPQPIGYRCFSCLAEFPAGTKFLKVVGLDPTSKEMVSGRMCPKCKDPTIFKVEK